MQRVAGGRLYLGVVKGRAKGGEAFVRIFAVVGGLGVVVVVVVVVVGTLWAVVAGGL
jgi:hypothetical protein